MEAGLGPRPPDPNSTSSLLTLLEAPYLWQRGNRAIQRDSEQETETETSNSQEETEKENLTAALNTKTQDLYL